MRRREFGTLTGGLALGLALPRLGRAADADLAAKSGQTVYFRGWQYKTDIVEDNVARYDKALNGKVDYATVTGDYPAIMEQNLMSGAELDVLYANPSQACRYLDGGWVMPAESLEDVEAVKADLYPNIRDAWTYKGKLLGLSYFVSTRGVMHVNLKRYGELGFAEKDLPKDWDELYDQVHKLKDKGVAQPLLPHWLNEWFGISWGFDFEVMNRGGQLADPESHKPTLTKDKDGPAYKTLAAWKRVWNDKLVPEEVLTYNESAYIQAYASGRFVFSPQQLYDLETFNRPDRSQIAGHASLVPYKGQSWGLIDFGHVPDDLPSARRRAHRRREAVRQLVRLQGPEGRVLRRQPLDAGVDAVLRLQAGDGEPGHCRAHEEGPGPARGRAGRARRLQGHPLPEGHLERGLGRGVQQLAEGNPGQLPAQQRRHRRRDRRRQRQDDRAQREVRARLSRGPAPWPQHGSAGAS